MEGILAHQLRYTGFVLNADAKSIPADKLPVTAIREGEVKGYHEVRWNSGAEQITIAHEAFDRKIFAEGAVMAAVWLAQKPKGIYTMMDILQL
jgi:4-hydroxy-tetrahydrodipicolinate reductase